MRIAVVIEARDGDGPINSMKLAEAQLEDANTIEDVIARLRKCSRFVKAMTKASLPPEAKGGVNGA
jgi:hypothetical protein